MKTNEQKIIEILESYLHITDVIYSRDFKQIASEIIVLESSSQEEQKAPEDKPTDTKDCKECGGRTALIHGSFYYEPDSEPYMSGIEEEAKVSTGECWVSGYKCDECGNIHGLWTE